MAGSPPPPPAESSTASGAAAGPGSGGAAADATAELLGHTDLLGDVAPGEAGLAAPPPLGIAPVATAAPIPDLMGALVGDVAGLEAPAAAAPLGLASALAPPARSADDLASEMLADEEMHAEEELPPAVSSPMAVE